MGNSARDFIAAQWTFALLDGSKNAISNRTPNGHGMGAARQAEGEGRKAVHMHSPFSGSLHSRARKAVAAIAESAERLQFSARSALDNGAESMGLDGNYPEGSPIWWVNMRELAMESLLPKS
jgi:hypothetical protein